MDQTTNDRPHPGDEVEMQGVETVIEISSVPEDQPDADDGIYTIVDQYGETHRVARDDPDGPWIVEIPGL